MSPKLKTRRTEQGFGAFACTIVNEGELLAMWGGQIVPEEIFAQLNELARNISIQVEEGLFLVPITPESADYINHSCDPNAGLTGQSGMIAMRDIMPGEEICFDYAMSDSTPYDKFRCECGAENCRKQVTGNDWQIEELWERYKGYFSPYLQRKIDKYRLSQGTTSQNNKD